MPTAIKESQDYITLATALAQELVTTGTTSHRYRLVIYPIRSMIND
ncbi:hypothetical protein NIES4074_52630 [Cylindrospermum sp. NIES-4074]|nr:hypothetical protein NIES4074_52630 [Cylindrospermum sp. NIES-4074]